MANIVETKEAPKDTKILFTKYLLKLTNSNNLLYPNRVGLFVQYLIGKEYISWGGFNEVSIIQYNGKLAKIKNIDSKIIRINLGKIFFFIG
jgi:hypothetical protein